MRTSAPHFTAILYYSAGMERIEANPLVCSGKPVIRGTRIMVRNILGMVAGGYTVKRIPECYPELQCQDVNAALECAARVAD